MLVSKISLYLHSVRRGDVIVFRHPWYGTMIKKVDRVLPDANQICVIGTQENSLDSREFGPVRKDALVGKVIWHIRRSPR